MKKLATIILACGIFASGLRQAAAAPTMRLSADGGVTWTNIVDNGPGDVDPTPGFIIYVGPIGNWETSIATGFGSPLTGDPLNPTMDVGTQDTSVDAQSLIVQMSDTGFIPFPNQTFIAQITVNTTGSVTYNTYRDSGNVLFGTTESYVGGAAGTSPSPTAATLINQGPFSNTINGGSNSVVVANGGLTPYSLTLETVIVHSGPATTQTDAFLFTLPPPVCNCTLTFNSPASITNCAGDTIPDIVATENCGNGSVSVPVNIVSTITTGTCPKVITRTANATDDCGKVSTFVQTITVNCAPACTIQGVTISNTSWNKFNIPNGTSPVVWVHAHIGGLSGVPKTGVTTVQFVGITISLDGTAYTMPDGVMIFDSSAPTAPSTTFSGGKWITTVNPNHLSDEMFFTGAAIPVTPTIAAGAKATLTYTTLASVQGISFNWQWSAAVYTYWPVDWNQAMIQPYHSNNHAGTPLNTTVQKSLIQGPRGGGGSNFTGSWSATGTAACQ